MRARAWQGLELTEEHINSKRWSEALRQLAEIVPGHGDTILTERLDLLRAQAERASRAELLQSRAKTAEQSRYWKVAYDLWQESLKIEPWSGAQRAVERVKRELDAVKLIYNIENLVRTEDWQEAQQELDALDVLYRNYSHPKIKLPQLREQIFISLSYKHAIQYAAEHRWVDALRSLQSTPQQKSSPQSVILRSIVARKEAFYQMSQSIKQLRIRKAAAGFDDWWRLSRIAPDMALLKAFAISMYIIDESVNKTNISKEESLKNRLNIIAMSKPETPKLTDVKSSALIRAILRVLRSGEFLAFVLVVLELFRRLAKSFLTVFAATISLIWTIIRKALSLLIDVLVIIFSTETAQQEKPSPPASPSRPTPAKPTSKTPANTTRTNKPRATSGKPPTDPTKRK